MTTILNHQSKNVISQDLSKEHQNRSAALLSSLVTYPLSNTIILFIKAGLNCRIGLTVDILSASVCVLIIATATDTKNIKYTEASIPKIVQHQKLLSGS